MSLIHAAPCCVGAADPRVRFETVAVPNREVPIEQVEWQAFGTVLSATLQAQPWP